MRALRRSLLIFSILSLASLIADPASAEDTPQVGKAAPKFQLRGRDGALTALGDLAYTGPERATRPKQVVVMDFFRTDCAPCKKAMPELIKLHKAVADQGVKFLLIALEEEEEGEEKLARYLRGTPVPFLVLVDSYQRVARDYVMEKGSLSIPKLFIIDRNGVLRGKYNGLPVKQIDQVKELIRGLVK